MGVIMRYMKLIVAAFALLILGSCDYPDCYYDNTCDEFGHYYPGYRSVYVNVPGYSSNLPNKGRGYSGTWKVKTTSVQTDCPYVKSSYLGRQSITQYGNSISVLVPGYGRYRGLVTRDGFKVSGRYKSWAGFCTVQGQLIYSGASPAGRTANATARFAANCKDGLRCRVEVKGKAAR